MFPTLHEMRLPWHGGQPGGSEHSQEPADSEPNSYHREPETQSNPEDSLPDSCTFKW